MALLSRACCALASCHRPALAIPAGRTPSHPVLAAPPPACKADFTLTSYLQSDVQTSYSALSSARKEGGAPASCAQQEEETLKGAPKAKVRWTLPPQGFHSSGPGGGQTSKGS